MKKKAIALMLAMSMTAMFCACGTSEDSSAGTAREDSASSAEDTETVTEEAGSEETEEDTEGSEEVNEYGFTASQQEALVESVKNAVTTDFLEPYNISPSEFVLQPYDVNDFYNYRLLDTEIGVYGREYIGDDPYETSTIWYTVDMTIFSYTDLVTRISLLAVVEGDDTEAMADEVESWLGDGTITIAPTLEDAKVSITDSSEEKIALGNAIYKGIAEFLNSLDSRECAELLVNLGLKCYNRETVVVTNEGSYQTREYEYPTTSIFDKAITENIQFA